MFSLGTRNKKVRMMVSIVIPIHNSYLYLHDCIASITKQSYEEIEIICVDDCSDTDTADALDHEAQYDDRIAVIHLKQSVGAAAARNIGLKSANGEYLIFLDSDDYFEADMVELLFYTITANNADIGVCGFDCFDDSSGEVLYTFQPKLVEGVTTDCFGLSQLGEDGLTIYNTAPWNKIFKRRFLEENELLFQSLSSSNDVSFIYRASLKANRIVYCSNKRPLVHYRVNTGTQISGKKNSINLYRAVKYVLDEIGDASELVIRQIIYAYLMLAVYELRECNDDKVNGEFYRYTRELLDNKAKQLRFKDPIANNRLTRFLTLDYESNWFGRGKEFYERIIDNYEKLSEVICAEDNILIWGNGEKSNSLQRVLKEGGFEKVSITDIKNTNVGERTESGYMIVDYSQALDCNRKVIASNHNIYCYLTQKGIRCIDLDVYCEERIENE